MFNTPTASTTTASPFKRIIRRKEVCGLVGLSRSTIYRLMRERLFPQSIQLGAQAVGWALADIEAWVSNRKLAWTHGA